MPHSKIEEDQFHHLPDLEASDTAIMEISKEELNSWRYIAMKFNAREKFAFCIKELPANRREELLAKWDIDYDAQADQYFSEMMGDLRGCGAI